MCRLGGGVQGDLGALMIATSSNDVDVLLLLLQAAHPSVAWALPETLQLPLARLLTVLSPADDCDEKTCTEQQVASTGSSHWASSEALRTECLLLDQIAEGCPYTLRQLQRAMASAAAAGLPQVGGNFQSLH
jgi:hypothetical protein